MSTLYLLGAGASAGSEFRLPLGTRLLQAVLDSEDHEWESPDDKKHLSDFVATFMRNQAEAPDIEECLTFLDCALSDLGLQLASTQTNLLSRRGDPYWSTPRKRKNASVLLNSTSVLRRVKSVLQRQIATALLRGCHGWCKTHALLFQDLGHNDNVITLNYDLIAENTIDGLNRPRRPSKPGVTLYGPLPKDDHQATRHVERLQELIEERSLFGPARGAVGHHVGEFSFGSIYHLHGAVNWLTCPDEACFNHARIHYTPEISEMSMMGGTLCASCGTMMEPVIVPPTMLKDYARYPKVRLMWALAGLALAACKHLVVVGCSFRPGDIYLQHLVRSSIRSDRLETVSFVGLGKEADESLRRFLKCVSFRPRQGLIRLHREGLEAYVTAVGTHRAGSTKRSSRTAAPPSAQGSRQ